MSKIKVKLIIAITIGLLVGTIVGYVKSNKSYYRNFLRDDVKISKEEYEYNIWNNKEEKRDYRIEETFNKGLALLTGVSTGAPLIIIILLPTLFKKEHE